MNAAELEEFNFLMANDETCRQQNTFFKAYWVKNEELYSNTNLMFQRIVSKIEVPETEIQENIEMTTEGFKSRRMIIFLRSMAALLAIGISLSVIFI
jgi:transmembrane sensor